MKINSINQQANNQQRQNFKGNLIGKTVQTIAEHPAWVATLAGSSVVAQKIVMSGSEAVIGPVMDVGIGHAITKATNEKDGRTNESSKVQAIRTFSQSVGGTIVGVAIRLLCIGALTAAFAKCGRDAGGKIGAKIADIINKDDAGKKIVDEATNKYLYKEHMEKWGKNVGGAVATLVMLVTNFIIDAPFINWINTKATEFVDKKSAKKPQEQVQQQVQAKEVK